MNSMNILLLCMGFVACPLSAERVIVDEIRCTLYTQEGARIKLSSDVKPHLDGRPRDVRDIVCDELMLCEAERYHIDVTPEDAERYMDELRKNNNMTRFAMERVIEEMDYTYPEALDQLRRRQMSEQLLDHRIRSDKRFMISPEEVAAFDKEHPVFEEGLYTLAEVLVHDAQALNKNFTAEELAALPWEESFVVKESELAEEMAFVIGANVGEIVLRDPVAEGVELTRLVAKKPRRRILVDEIVDPRTRRTLQDKIVEVIRMQRYEDVVREYQDELLRNATLRFAHPQDRLVVLGEDK